MDWLLIGQMAYVIILILLCMRIVYDTRSIPKSFAYLLFAIFIPFIGMISYAFFGTNYRKRKFYEDKQLDSKKLDQYLGVDVADSSEEVMDEHQEEGDREDMLARYVLYDHYSPLTDGNDVTVLRNGEHKFEELKAALKAAKKHINIEYFIFEDGRIGQELKEILIERAREGVEIRFIFDDFGSRTIRDSILDELREVGVSANPFYSIRFYAFANRINYRNHRKIVVIDGITAFVGGINVSDEYINRPDDPEDKKYWRDTHIRIVGPGAAYLQFIFISDWNSCAEEGLDDAGRYFLPIDEYPTPGRSRVQIVSSGPDSDRPSILYAMYRLITLAEKEILLTTPYFVPVQGLLDVLLVSSLSGVRVKLLIPMDSDFKLIDKSSCSYFDELLESGIEIYRYTKGMIHAKTTVVDGEVSMVGTANLDIRSFDLNFEVNAIVYDEEVAGTLRDAFFKDLEEAEQVDAQEWTNRKWTEVMPERLARLMSPMM